MGGYKESPRRGLFPMEWAVLAYIVLTLLLMAFMWGRLVDPMSMLLCRVLIVAMLVAFWGLYQLRPCRLTHFLRVGGQLAMLGLWYSETYEFNRFFPNLDHLFAAAEQAVFGFQPALTFSQSWPHPVVSELLIMGYVSYFPLIVLVVFFYFIKRYDDFDRATFVIMGSFFLFYIVFIFLPVTGPQYYYLAVGCDQIAAGVFPDVGNYFEHHQESLPIPGLDNGLFYHCVQGTHDAGERPTAAFPSSHVGITVVLLWLAWHSRSRWLLWFMMPFAVLMFFATFYIQAHYAIDAIAGIFAGTLLYFLCQYLYDRFPTPLTKNRKA